MVFEGSGGLFPARAQLGEMFLPDVQLLSHGPQPQHIIKRRVVSHKSMFIREARPEEGEEVAAFHWASLLASHDGSGPKLGPPSLWARPESRAYFRQLRLRGVADPAVRSVVAFSGTDDGVPGNRGEIIGHIELGPPGGFSPLTNVCDWELLSVYSSGRGKGIAAQLIRYALAVALGPAQVQEKLGVHLNRSLESAQQSRNGTTQPAGTTRSDAKHALGVITINENVVGRSFYTKLGGKLTETYTVTLLDEKIGCVAFVWDWEGIHRLMS